MCKSDKMPVRKGEVTFLGNPLTLRGPKLRVGDKAPNFCLLRQDLSEATLRDFAGRTLLIAAVPSLDTPVCDLEAKRFNEEAAKRPNVTVLVVSMDLPFAQSRWCGATGAKNIVTLSDHRSAEFGADYGVLISELRLLARAVFVIGPDGVIRHLQIVPEVAHQPDFDKALAALA